MGPSYADFVATILAGGGSPEHTDSLIGRAFFTTLFGEACHAVAELRARGTLLVLEEWSTADAFALKANGREVRFARVARARRIEVWRSGFPPLVVSWDAQYEGIPVPADLADHGPLALGQVRAALSVLLKAC